MHSMPLEISIPARPYDCTEQINNLQNTHHIVPENPWSLSVMSININGMNSALWQSVIALDRSKYVILFVQEARKHDREIIEKLKTHVGPLLMVKRT